MRREPGRGRPLGQASRRRTAGRVIVAHDVEAAQARREGQGGEVIGRQRGDRRQGGQGLPERQHRLDPFAGGEHVAGAAEPHAVAEQVAQGPARRGDRRLAAAVAGQPGALDAGDRTGFIGDGGDQRRPDLARREGLGPVPAGRVKAQGGQIAGRRDAAGAEVGLGQGAGDRPGVRPQPGGGIGRAAGCGLPGRRRRTRQAQEGAGLVQRGREAGAAAVEADQVEQIAVFAAGGVGPVTGGAAAGGGAGETHIQAAAGRVADIADQPVAALAAAVGEKMAAHRLGILREAGGQRRGWAGHGEGSGSGMKTAGQGRGPGAALPPRRVPQRQAATISMAVAGALSSGAGAVIPAVRSTSGSQPVPASSCAAASAISGFFRPASGAAAASPLASRTASRMRALVTRPR